MSKHFEEDDLFDRFAILSRAVEAGAEWLAGDLADVNKTIDRRLASFCEALEVSVKRPTILPINSQADYEKKHGIPPDQYDEPDNFKSRLSEPPNPVDATPDTPTGIAERGRKLIAFSEIRETVRLDIIHYRPNKTDDKILAYLGESEEPTAKLMALYITNTIEDVIANSAPDALADHYKLLVIGADRLEIWGDQYRRLHNNPSLYRLIPQDVVDMFEDMGLFTKQRYMGHVVAEAMRSAADKVLHHLTGLRMAGQY